MSTPHPLPEPTFYPETPARLSRLAVTGGHELQLYEWGDPQGQPALLLHGGPGSGLSTSLARFFDPQRYRVLGLDQRGAGRSTPSGGTANNESTDLLADLRAMRSHFGIERWLVVGGSWGATLALMHAADAPDAVAGLLLRGVFLAREEDVDAFFHAEPPGFGSAWQPWRERAAREGLPFTVLLDDILQQGTSAEQAALTDTWWRFEQAMDGDAPSPAASPAPATLLSRYRVQAHYLRLGCGLVDEPLLQRIVHLPQAPILMLHGVLDRICPMAGAEEVQAALPQALLRRVEGAGHAPTQPAMAVEMRRALDAFAARGRFDGDDA